MVKVNYSYRAKLLICDEFTSSSNKAFSLCFIIITSDCAARGCRFMFTEMSLSLDTLNAGEMRSHSSARLHKNSGR